MSSLLRRIGWTTLVSLAFGCSACAQPNPTSCYEPLLHTGQRYLQQQRFAQALGQFRTALQDCDDLPPDHPLDSLILAVQRAEVAFLAARNRRLQELIAEVRDLNQQERQARQAAEAAQRLAERNAAEARRQEAIAIRNGRRAASLRLSTLAELELAEGHPQDAWPLVLLALHWSDSVSYPQAMRALTRVAVDSFAHRRRFPADIRAVRVYDSTADVLAGAELQRVALHAGSAPLLNVPARELVAGTETGLLLRQDAGYLWLRDRLRYREPLPASAPIRLALLLDGGSQLLVAGADSTLRFWPGSPQGAPAEQPTRGRNYALFSLDATGRTFATRSSAGVVEVWPADLAGSPRVLTTNDSYVYTALSKGGNVLAGTANGQVLLFPPGANAAHVLTAGPAAVTELIDLAGSESLFLVRNSDGALGIWDLGGRQLSTLAPGGEMVGVRDWPAAQQLLVWTADRRVTRWSYTGALLGTVSGFPSPIIEAAPLPQTPYWAVTGAGGEYWLYENDTRVGEIAVTATVTTLPRYCADRQALVWVSPTGDELVHMPLPQALYANHRAGFDFAAVPERLVAKYSIESWD